MFTQTPIRVVIADDHEIFRDGLRLMLKRENSIEIVGEAANGLELIDVVKDSEADIVLTDIVMPKMDGIAAVKEIVKMYPYMGVIALSMFDGESLIVEILEAGAMGYLLKNADKAEIIEAIKSVNNHMPYYCKTISLKFAKQISQSKFNPYKNKPRGEFNEKELLVIQYVCKELSNKEIAEKLFVSTRTVEGYRLKIMEKMNVKNTAGIVIYAIKHGIYKVQ